MAYLDESGLNYFWSKIMAKFTRDNLVNIIGNFGGATATRAGTSGLVPPPSTADTLEVFTGATSTKNGTSGLVPPPTTRDV